MGTRVAVVTGSNKGIGYAIVRALCSKFDGDVFLTARNEERGKAAVQELEKEGLKPKLLLLDISSQESIKALGSFLKTHYGGIDILVNNAAIAYKAYSCKLKYHPDLEHGCNKKLVLSSSPYVSKLMVMADTTPFPEQAKSTVNVNFFDTLNVCVELFPLLRPHARVVNLSSSAGKLSRIPGEELRKKFSSTALTTEELCALMSQFINDAKAGIHIENGWGNSAYVVSKVGVTALTFIQQREFLMDSREDIVVNAVHPGYVDTDMTSHNGPLTIDQGAEAPVYCALLPPNIESPKGEYIWNDKSIASWV